MGRGSKKERHRLKRQARHREARRAAAVTPLKRLTGGAGTIECYLNPAWRDDGMAMIYVLGTTPGGRCALASFLVDAWCVGLKDAFGRAEFPRGDFEHLLREARRKYDVVRVDPAEAIRLLTAGIRFARRNGFRLPEHWERWVAIFAPVGGLGDVAQADLEGFGIDGGTRLRYMGTPQFLRERLIAATAESFLARDDVEWCWGDGRPRSPDDLSPPADDAAAATAGALADLDEEELAELEMTVEEMVDAIEPMRAKMEHAVREWCRVRGEPAHPMIGQAVGLLMMAMLPAVAADSDEDDDDDTSEEAAMEGDEGTAADDNVKEYAIGEGQRSLDAILEMEPPERRAQIEDAIDQVTMFIDSFPSPPEMFAALGDVPPPQQP